MAEKKITLLEQFLRKRRIYTKFMKNVKSKVSNPEYVGETVDLINGIAHAFYWYRTTEGGEHWKTVNKDFAKYRQQHDTKRTK